MMGREPALSWSDTLRWCIAGAVVLGLHGAAFVAIMQAPEGDPEGLTEQAIMIDLEPVAVMNTQPVERIDTPEQAEPLEPEEPPPLEQPELVEPVEPLETLEAEPVETAELAEPIEQPEAIEPLEAEPEPVEPEQMLEEEEPPLEEVEPIEPEPVDAESDVALAPTPRPRAERPPSVERPRQQRRQPAEPVDQQAPRQQRQPPRQPQQQSASRPPPGQALNTWTSAVNRYVSSLRRESGIVGTVRVRFTIDARGRVTSASLAASSGNASLDQTAVSLIRDAGPFPAPPPEILKGGVVSISLPIKYTR